MKPILSTLVLLVLFLATPPDSGAQEGWTLEDALNSGATWAQSSLPPEILNQLTLPSAGDWKQFINQVQQELQTGSIEDLAEWKPYVEVGIQILSQMKDGADYADWLRQRLDYFEMAAATVGNKPGPVISGHTLHLAPPPRKGASRIPAALVQKREQQIRSQQLWKQKLKNRPVSLKGKALIPLLKKVFREERIPPSLVWIAEVESSLNPRARNPVGAAGLFQFMPATAKRFQLKLTPVDERTDPEKSARAAARYLRFLYGEFHSWPLALAAYNAGEGRVQKLLDGHATKTFEAIAPDLPIETRMYVPKVLALINLREGVDL